MFVHQGLEGAYPLPGGLRGRMRPQVPGNSARLCVSPLSTRYTTEHHRQHTRRAPSTHPQRDGPRGGVVDGSPSAQRTSSTVRRPPGSGAPRLSHWPSKILPSKCVRHFSSVRDVTEKRTGSSRKSTRAPFTLLISPPTESPRHEGPARTMF